MQLTNAQIIALSKMSGVGNAVLNKLIAQVNAMEGDEISTDDLYDLYLKHKVSMGKRTVIKGETLDALEKHIANSEIILDKERELGIGVVSVQDLAYPPVLKKHLGKDAPAILHYKGNLEAVHHQSVAITGHRETTKEVMAESKFFSKYYADHGFNIVSNLARGCNTEAHLGALEVKGLTTAVLAGGLDTIAPISNNALASEIVNNNGLLLSEYEIGVPAVQYNFAKRDRILAGLSSATLIIQSKLSGGSVIAARTTLQFGGNLFAVKLGDTTQTSLEQMLKGSASPLQSHKHLTLSLGQYLSHENAHDLIKAIEAPG